MFVATGALILPAAFDAGLPDEVGTESGVLALSRGAAVVLLVIYALFLVYQFKTHPHVFDTGGLDEDDEDAGGVEISPWVAGLTLLIVTLAVSFCSDFLVGSIDDVVESLGISKTFVGLILVPVVGNAGSSMTLTSLTEIAEIVTCINLGYRGKMDLVVAITLGSCMQIALFLTPFLVVLGWFLNVPMTLSTIHSIHH